MNPSAEPTLSELKRREITVERAIYRAPTCAVYKAFRRNQAIALKLILYPVTADTEVAAREVANQLNCAHPHIAELYGYFWYYSSAIHWVGALEIELLEKDLYSDIQTRANTERPYEDYEIVKFVMVMTSALSTAQKMGICHRDVKPQNVFISLQGEFKLGDFGSSKQNVGNESEMTITGTPSYLSPILRAGLGFRQRCLAHNPFKSDVYSLGLTALHMAMLQPLSIFGGDVRDLVASALPQLRYSDYIKQLLAWMLNGEETHRPDFVAIDNYFSGVVQAPEVVHTCQHTGFDKVVLQCGHKLCEKCALLRESALQKSTILTCSVCGQTSEYIFSNEEEYRGNQPQFTENARAEGKTSEIQPVANNTECGGKFLYIAASVRRSNQGGRSSFQY